jgi:hypothetical protein
MLELSINRPWQVYIGFPSVLGITTTKDLIFLIETPFKIDKASQIVFVLHALLGKVGAAVLG